LFQGGINTGSGYLSDGRNFVILLKFFMIKKRIKFIYSFCVLLLCTTIRLPAVNQNIIDVLAAKFKRDKPFQLLIPTPFPESNNRKSGRKKKNKKRGCLPAE
jgi:hypothetical protein